MISPLAELSQSILADFGSKINKTLKCTAHLFIHIFMDPLLRQDDPQIPGAVNIISKFARKT